jgi:hypothetical protein
MRHHVGSARRELLLDQQRRSERKPVSPEDFEKGVVNAEDALSPDRRPLGPSVTVDCDVRTDGESEPPRPAVKRTQSAARSDRQPGDHPEWP